MSIGYTLDGQEVVIHKIQKHWIALAPIVAASGMIVLVVIGLSYIMARFRSSLPAFVTPGLVGLVILLLLLIAVFIVLAGIWVYHRNYILLTSKHLIRMEQQGLFSRNVSQLSLSRLQDVSSSTPGMIATILGYGSLTIQTAGEEDNFVFTQMPKPSEIADECLAAHDKYADHPDGINVSPPVLPQPPIVPPATPPSY